MRVVDPLPPSELRGPAFGPHNRPRKRASAVPGSRACSPNRLWEQAPLLPPVYWILPEEAPVSLYFDPETGAISAADASGAASAET